ncbi:hypothetical protein NW062_01215 [Mycoplasmopsis cynos]|nr:hypothetical protein NW062_01215 [Mycoplasmopsis cynos]
MSFLLPPDLIPKNVLSFLPYFCMWFSFLKFLLFFLTTSYLLLTFSKVTPLSYNSKAFFHFSSFEASVEPFWFSSFLSIPGLSVLAVSPFSVFLSFASGVLLGLLWDLSLPSFSFSWFLFFASSLSFGVLVAGGVIFFPYFH